jgi:hypothetical protein
MWDEDEEEEQEEQMKALQELNSRTWSHESRAEVKKTDNQESPASQVTIKGDVDDDLVADGFFFQDSPTMKPVLSATPRYSPPSKRFNYDKWAALGQRRRGQTTISEMEKSPGLKSRRQFGVGYKSYEAGVWDHATYNNNSNTMSKNWGRDRTKECPRNKGRDWNWRRDHRRNDLGDVEWVGGW